MANKPGIGYRGNCAASPARKTESDVRELSQDHLKSGKRVKRPGLSGTGIPTAKSSTGNMKNERL